MSTKIYSLVSLFLVMSFVLMACGPQVEPTIVPATQPAAQQATEAPVATEAMPTEIPAEAPQQGGTLILGIRQEPSSLDPQGSANAVSQRALASMYDSLVWMTREGKFYPWLATSWTISDDGLEYTFKLRDDVTFHDGTPLTAEAVQVMLDRIRDPETGSTSAASALGPYDHTEIIDDHTAKVVLSAPYGPFLYALSQPFFGIPSPTAVKKYGNKEFIQHPTGSGPFMLEENVPQDHITLVRNPDYKWAPTDVFDNPGPASLERIIIRTIPEASTRLASLLNGEVNAIEPVPAQDLASLEADPNYYVLKPLYSGAGRLMFLNTKKAPTDDIDVRRAIMYAVDDQALVDLVFFGVQQAGRSPLSPATLGYDERFEHIYSYDPEKAKQILDDAGWVEGSDGIREKDGQRLSLVMYVIADNPETEQTSEFIQGQLREVGMEVELLTLARAAWYEGLNNGDHNLVALFFIYGDPDVLRLIYHSDNIPFNWSHWTDPETDQLLEEAYQTNDVAKRLELYDQIQQIIMDQALVLTLFYEYNLMGFSKDIEGVLFDVTAYPLFYGVTINQ
jgi:peptide/nickel transport system substrate-binding protein